MTTSYRFTLKSKNAKTGAIPVTTTSSNTCSDACPLKANGSCYAKQGPLGIVWQQVDAGKFSGGLDKLAEQISALPQGTLWRHNQAGDLPGDGDDIDVGALNAIVDANSGKKGFTYTHKPLTAENLDAIAHANAQGFTINLSGNSLAEVDRLTATGLPVTTVLPIEYGRTYDRTGWTETVAEYKARLAELPSLTTAGGVQVEPCPATYLDTDCKRCGLCQKRARKVAVGFPAHGAKAKLASQIAA